MFITYAKQTSFVFVLHLDSSAKLSEECCFRANFRITFGT